MGGVRSHCLIISLSSGFEVVTSGAGLPGHNLPSVFEEGPNAVAIGGLVEDRQPGDGATQNQNLRNGIMTTESFASKSQP